MADCHVSDFTSKTGTELVEQIQQSETTCINTLFNVSGEDSKALFREEQHGPALGRPRRDDG
ncbi:M9 family metallopeptidase N-terminal domain-containing protein [Streptomyces sp. NPDC047049]|uniref:M9 family metallopeptidase N-terminal domain-containing protein n=1 Tax=Streptomyces sp. NPDC047049 TaxID=3156688 RepID=UPI0033C3C556